MIPELKRGWLRALTGIFISIFVMSKSGQFYGSPWLLTSRIIILLLYASFFALPMNWWNTRRIILATIGLSILVIGSLFLQNDLFSIYMLIILTIPAAYILEYPVYFYYLSVLLLEMFLLLIIFGHNYQQSLSLIILFIGIGLSIRARVARLESYRISQLHLKELEKAHQELQQAAVTTMQHAVLDERTRIAREIHDAIGHSLTSLIIQLQALRYMIDSDPAQAQHSVEEMLSVARQGLTDIRVSVHALAADRSALGITALQALVSKMNSTTQLNCTFTANSLAKDIPVEMGSVLFNVLQEAMTNILRHSQATLVDVNVVVSRTECRMSIKDNGKFTDTELFLEGYGMRTMRERVQEAAGILEFRPGNPSGLIITTTIPYAFNE